VAHAVSTIAISYIFMNKCHPNKRCLKKRMVKTLIWSVTLYCAEIGTLREENITRLKAFEMWIWHRMKKISWTEHISNEEVLKLV